MEGTLRLYTKHKEEGWGLVSIRATIQDEAIKIHEYNRNMAPNDELMMPSEYLKQQKPKKE